MVFITVWVHRLAGKHTCENVARMMILPSFHGKFHVHMLGVHGMAISTNRPPKGDRSDGFYIKISILIDFGTISNYLNWPDFPDFLNFH